MHKRLATTHLPQPGASHTIAVHSILPSRALMSMGSEKSDDAHSDNCHEGAEADHNEVECGHEGCSLP